MSVKDYEHQLQLEISENEIRKDFSQLERLDYAKRLEQIERLKAKERQGSRNDIVENFPQCEEGKTRDKVAQATGFGSGKQYEKAKFIAEHADQETLDKWDKGDISTHAAYKDLQAKLRESEEWNRKLQQQLHAEMSKPEPEPIVEIINETPPEVLAKLQKLEDDLAKKEAALTTLQERKKLTTEYEAEKERLAGEIANLMAEHRKVREAVNEEKFRLNCAAEFMAEFGKGVKAMHQAKGKLESLAPNAIFHWSQVRGMRSGMDVVCEVISLVENMLNTVSVSTDSEEGIKNG